MSIDTFTELLDRVIEHDVTGKAFTESEIHEIAELAAPLQPEPDGPARFLGMTVTPGGTQYLVFQVKAKHLGDDEMQAWVNWKRKGAPLPESFNVRRIFMKPRTAISRALRTRLRQEKRKAKLERSAA